MAERGLNKAQEAQLSHTVSATSPFHAVNTITSAVIPNLLPVELKLRLSLVLGASVKLAYITSNGSQSKTFPVKIW